MKINLNLRETKFLILGDEYEPKNLLETEEEMYLRRVILKYSYELIVTNKTHNMKTESLCDLELYLKKIFPYEDKLDNVANAQGYRIGDNGYSKKLGIIVFIPKSLPIDELLNIITSKGRIYFTKFIGKYVKDKNMVIYGEGNNIIETKKYITTESKKELILEGYEVTMSESDGIAWRITE